MSNLSAAEHQTRAVELAGEAGRLHEIGAEWAAVAYFYSAYHRVRAALLDDPVFDDMSRLKRVDPQLLPSDRDTAFHTGRRRGQAPEFGVNDLVLLLMVDQFLGRTGICIWPVFRCGTNRGFDIRFMMSSNGMPSSGRQQTRAGSSARLYKQRPSSGAGGSRTRMPACTASGLADCRNLSAPKAGPSRPGWHEPDRGKSGSSVYAHQSIRRRN